MHDDGCKCLISVECNLQLEANVVVSERTVCYRVETVGVLA